MRSLEKLAKITYLRATLAPDLASDAFLLEQVMAAIDFAITGAPETPASFDAFVARAEGILGDSAGDVAFRVVDLHGAAACPLWERLQIVQALKALTGYRQAVLVLLGTHPPHRKKRRRGRLRRTYRLPFEERRDYIDRLAARHCGRHTRLILLYL